MQKLGYLLLGFLTVHSARAVPDGVPTAREAPSSRGQMLLGNGVSVKPLDLSRAPTTDELMAAGQLGGALFPTRELGDKRRDEAARWDFGKAIEEWNKHEYPKAVHMFRKHVEDFPDSPWAAEALLHVGCDGTYNGRYTEAEAIFQKLITDHQGKDHPGAKMLLNKARQRLALLKVEQNNLGEAEAWFTGLLLDSTDWRQRTYASHWIQRLARYKAANQALLTCGVDALGYVLEKDGRHAAAQQVRTNVPSTMRGHNLADLVNLAAAQGYQLAAIQNTPADLPRLPLPAILHIGARNPGDSGHYWVLDKVTGDQVELFDPQSGRRFHQAVEEFARQWSGRTLVFTKGGSVPGRKLDLREMEANSGGCCGAPAPPDKTGSPCRNGSSGSQQAQCPTTPPSQGAPAWSVNMINMNLFVTDTPLWYDPPIGPSVSITVSYNSQSSVTHNEPFGSKWQFNYGSYLVVDTSGSVLIFMPDGRYDVFSPNGAGGYRKPYQVFNTLTRIADNYFELRLPDDTVYVYRIPPGTSSQQPFLTEIRDAHGNPITISYDANVHITAITAADGKVFTLSYNASGLCTNAADPFGRSARFEYDASRNLTKIIDMGGYWSSFTYDANAYLTSIANERGTWGFWIEPSGPAGNSDNYPPPGDPNTWANYRITITNPVGQREEFFYYGGCDQDWEYGCGGQTWYVSPRDYIPWQSQQVNNYRSRTPKTRYLPTLSGQQGEISKTLYPEGDYVQYGYDTSTGNRTSFTDTHGHTWRYTFNALGRATSVTDAKGTTTAFTYATNGVDLLSASNGLGQILMAYNPQHDLISLTDRLTNTTTFAYNAYGQILAQVDALAITNDYLYDASHHLAELRRAGQTLERLTYDAAGRVRTRTDTTGLTVTNDYNGLNQVVRITYPDGRFESYTYSTCCPRLLDSVTDRGGRITLFIHDALKRLVQTVNPEGGITQFGYDANGNRTSLTDPNGNVTTFAYDLDNRLIRKTYADNKGLSFRYDQAGLLTIRTNARGITTAYTYDANHNLLTTKYSDDTPGVTNTYDAFNRRTLVKDGVGTNAYAYDANSRLVSFDGPWADDTITYGFDVLGRRKNLVVQGSQPNGYEYDALNRLTGVRVGAQTYAYTYAGASPLAQRLDRPNGSFTAYQYDGLNRLTSLSNRRSTGEVINEFLYAYNAQGLRASETVSNGLTLTFTNEHVTYDYNRLNQLGTSAPPSQVLAYDHDGNMTRGFTPDGLPFGATYDAENRLKTVSVTNGGSVTHRTTFLYGWNNLVAQEGHEQPSQSTNLVRCVRDLYLAIQQRDNGNSLVSEYTWGRNKGGGIGGLLKLRQGGKDFSYVYDGKGNVTALVDSSQAAATAYGYDAFGTLVSTAGNLDQPFRFSTKPYMEYTGLLDFGYRRYSPTLGRWLNRDPIGEGDGMNLYAYVRNAPTTRNDPFGLSDDPNDFGGQCSIFTGKWIDPWHQNPDLNYPDEGAQFIAGVGEAAGEAYLAAMGIILGGVLEGDAALIFGAGQTAWSAFTGDQTGAYLNGVGAIGGLIYDPIGKVFWIIGTTHDISGHSSPH
jgi:RHS repeat-associated protein